MIMKDFNWTEFKEGRIVVHCKRKYLAEHFLNKCVENGIINDKERTGFLDCWNQYKENTCYTTYQRFSHDELDYYKNRCSYKYRIVEWELTPENKEDIEEIAKVVTKDEFVKLVDMYELAEYCPNDFGINKTDCSSRHVTCIDCWSDAVNNIKFKGDNKKENIQINNKLEGDNKMELNELKDKLSELETTTNKAITELKLEIEKKENEIKEKKVKVWKPKYGETYYFIDSEGKIIKSKWTNHEFDDSRYVIGNCFKTEAEAEKAKAKLILLADLKRFAQENNEGEIDWNDCIQNKYSILYCFSDKSLDIECNQFMKYSILPYFTSEEIAQKAIDTFKDRLISLFIE